MNEQNTTAVAKVANPGLITHQEVNMINHLAQSFHKSGCFPASVKNPEQALVIMMYGRDMGFSPTESFGSLYLVNGAVNIYGSALARIFTRNNYKIDYNDSDDNSYCKVTVTNKLDPTESYSYTAKKEEVSGGKAYKINGFNKLRYHGLRQILRFNLPHLTSLIGVDEDFAETPEGQQALGVDPEVINSNQSLMDEFKGRIEHVATMKDIQAIGEDIANVKLDLSQVEVAELKKLMMVKHTELKEARKKEEEPIEAETADEPEIKADPETGEVIDSEQPSLIQEDNPEDDA